MSANSNNSAAQFVLAIDQGTTGTTVSLIQQNGELKAKVNLEFEQIYPKAGWVEHNPEEIWKTVETATQSLLQSTGVSASSLACIGITNQRETVVSWDQSTGQHLYNAIVWQCRRTTEFTQSLKDGGHSDLIKQKTGLVIDPYFSSSKYRWLLKNVSSVQSAGANLKFGTIDSYLIWKMTSGDSHVTDVSNASRTQLMNIASGKWDSELLDLFEVPAETLPTIRPSSVEFGKTKGMLSLPDGIPITGVAGDQQAALFGQACFLEGEAKCTFGTGSFILMNTGEKMVTSNHGILTTVGWQLGESKPMTYALEGGAFICGAAVQWLRDGLGVIENSAEVEELAKQVEDTDGVQMLPAFAGLGAPHWSPEVRAMITGMTRGTSKAHLARATLEAMAMQNAEILEAMSKDLNRPLVGLKVDGGASSNDLLMQMQSDFLQAETTRPELIETTSAGAAFLAGLEVRFWKDLEEVKSSWKTSKEFQPKVSSEQVQHKKRAWNRLTKMAMEFKA